MKKDKSPGGFRQYDPALLEAWRQGVARFNEGLYWEAHEEWERGWKTLPEPERSWVQAWIQVAGVLHLRALGRTEAAGALSLRALELLERAREMRAVLPRLEIEGAEAFLRAAGAAPALKAVLLLPSRL